MPAYKLFAPQRQILSKNFKDYPTFAPSLTKPFTILGFWGRYRDTGLYPGVMAGVTAGRGRFFLFLITVGPRKKKIIIAGRRSMLLGKDATASRPCGSTTEAEVGEGLVGVSMVGEERAQIHAKDKTSTQRGGDVEAGHFQYVGGSGGTGKSTWLIKAIQTVIDIKGVKNVQYSMPQVSDERCKQRWRRRKVLIVDEVSMLGLDTLY